DADLCGEIEQPVSGAAPAVAARRVANARITAVVVVVDDEAVADAAAKEAGSVRRVHVDADFGVPPHRALEGLPRGSSAFDLETEQHATEPTGSSEVHIATS